MKAPLRSATSRASDEDRLEPACVIVCPEHAIIAGDMSDPASEAAQLVAREPVRVRKPEQGTQPKLYYIFNNTCIVSL